VNEDDDDGTNGETCSRENLFNDRTFEVD